MSKTLAQMRSLVQAKLDNVGQGDDVVWQPGEIDEHINEAILHIGYVGSIELIQASLYKKTAITITSGLSTKPTDYFRWVYGRVDTRHCRLITPDRIDTALYDSLQGGGTKNKYAVNYSGTQFQIFPDSSASLELHYIAQLTELSSDTDTSPLTRVGDRYAVDWAYALCLEAKGLSPNIAIPIFNRVSTIIGQERAFNIASGGQSSAGGGTTIGGGSGGPGSTN